MSRMKHHTARVARIGAAGATLALAVFLAACSSSAAATSSASSSTSGSSNSALASKVAELKKLPSSYPMPSGSISNVSSLKGKTVYYVPLTLQAPQFGVTQKAVVAAFDKVGIKVQTCNANANPTGVAQCFTQATKGHAIGIITDAVPYVMAAAAFQNAASAGIPVLNTNNSQGGGAPAASDKLGYIYAPADAQMDAVMDWIANDSKGTAHILVNEDTDGPSPVEYVASGKKELTKVCPNCTLTINKISTSNFSLVAPSTSAALLKNPSINYVISEFDQFLQPTQGGVQQASKTSSVKGASGAAQLAGLQQLSKKNFTYVEAGQASVYQGWVDADAILRMATGTAGSALPQYTIPIRLFDASNIGDIKLTDAAQSSGEWYGPKDYTDKFATLWGVN